MTERQRPVSTRAEIVTAACVALSAAVVIGGGFAFAVIVYLVFQLAAAFGAGTQDAGEVLAVPAVETLCLNYAATVLELDTAGLDHDAIVDVIESAVQGEDTSSSEMDKLRELSLSNASVCGSVRDVLDAAGR